MVDMPAIRRHGILPVGKTANDGKKRVKHRKPEDQERHGMPARLLSGDTRLFQKRL